MNAASVSVIIVSDYAAGEGKSWDGLREALQAWAHQDYEGTAEFVLVESARYQQETPDDLRRLSPPFRALYFDANSSYELKNRAVQAVQSDIVAVVDADCIPSKSWLRLMMTTMNEHPEVIAVSGQTRYPGDAMSERILCLLARSYLDPGRKGSTRFISGNAAGFRRKSYDRHLLPEGLGAFASQIQSEAMLRDGGKFFFDPDMVVVHDFEGWGMERDIRRNHGYGTVITRLTDERLPYAGLIRAGTPAIPLIAAGKVIHSFFSCLRCWASYDVHWYELPVAFLYIVVTHTFEIPGMLAAYRHTPNAGTAFR